MAAAPDPRLDAIVLTGGASRRMGVDKASQLWAGRRAIDHVVDLARAVGAGRIVTSGPGAFGLPRALDPAPHAGPVAGLLAGLRALRASGEGRGPGGESRRVLVLAVDAPTIRPADIADLLGAEPPGAAFADLPLPMVFSPAAAPADAEDDWPLRRFVERANLNRPPPDPSAATRLRGANTPKERRRLAREAGWGDTPA